MYDNFLSDLKAKHAAEPMVGITCIQKYVNIIVQSNNVVYTVCNMCIYDI